MKILEFILGFIKTAFSGKYLTITLGVLSFLLIVSMFTTCSNLNREKAERKRDAKMYENNLRASNDSLRTYYDKKLDQMITEKTSFIVDEMSDLKKQNKELYGQFKDVKNMVAGVKSDVNIIIPTISDKISTFVQDSKDSTKFTIPFSFPYSDEGLTQSIIGNTNFKIRDNKPVLPITSSLTTNTLNVKLRYAFKEENGKYIINATSPSDLVKFTELDGALILDKFNKIIPPKKTSRFAIGPYVGFGFNTDMVGQNARLGWGAGVSLTYNIFSK